MSSMAPSKSTAIHQKLRCRFYKLFVLSALLLYIIIYIVTSNHPCCQSSTLFTDPCFPTNITHLVFGISASSNTWNDKKHYVESWWLPNITRGSLFLDRPPTEHLPWPSAVDPPFKVSEGHDNGVRMARAVVEAFRAEKRGVRWYVMAEDDTVFFVNNLVEVLGKYDHRKYYYVGMNSECIVANWEGGFGMGFGGGGYALSYPLVEALAENLDLCIRRYEYGYGSGHVLQSCVADLGVSLTLEKGFHQIDLRGDISGFLSSHPQSPILSLHHLDTANPIFPSLNRHDSLNHLMKAAQADEPRLLQQTNCYHKPTNWTFSESIFPPSILQRPIETFLPWKKGAMPPFVFNTRLPSKHPCEAPHVFFFDSMEEPIRGRVVTRYVRRWQHQLPACSESGNHSADHISKIHVVSPIGKLDGVGSRRECCDVLRASDMNATVIKLRACLKDEIVA
ncbi:unnamed protein product [Camellia sinensis]